MCLILFAYQSHPQYPLIVLANRDEFYERPAAPVHWWEDKPEILAGKDLKGGGTWMGVSASGRFSALTNYRDPQNILADAPSRGDLVTDFLTRKEASKSYMQGLVASAPLYNGYNLLTHDGSGLYHFSNQDQKPTEVAPGIYGLSNAFLDTPWPKVARGKSSLNTLLQGKDFDLEAAFSVLGNKEKAPDADLPETGVSLEWERRLSPMHITSEVYGTRCSTVFILGRDGKITYEERTFVPKSGVERFEFEVG